MILSLEISLNNQERFSQVYDLIPVDLVSHKVSNNLKSSRLY